VATQPTTIGRYQVIRRLGAGGMGAVYLARDPDLDRQLAIKLVKDDLSDDPELRERFTREARSAARLRHHNIITVFDIGEYEGRPFIAMEFIPGESLADVIRRGEVVETGRALGWMESLAAGLAHAHKSGIVHRDIKPGNLMVDPEGTLKIVDFGIARLGESNLTREGMLVGTANYMAPEQLLGSGADFRSDIFAVGAVCYELLTLRRAFPGTISDGLFTRICHEQPPALAELRPDLDGAVIDIVNRALEKDPVRRYQDLAVMAQHVARVRSALPPSGDPSEGAGAQTFAPTMTPNPAAMPRHAASAPSLGHGPRPTPPSPGATPPPPTPMSSSRSAYDVGNRPSGGFALPGSGATPASSAQETESQRRRRSDIFLDAAEMAIGQGDFEKASRLLDDAARFDAGSPAVASMREQVAHAAEEARVAAARAAEISGLLAQARGRFGEHDFEGSRAILRKLLELDRDNWDAQSMLGRIEKAELSARQAALRAAEQAAQARSSSRSTLWIIVAIVVIAAVTVGLYLMSR
jgi:serine/threonine protein kinase